MSALGLKCGCPQSAGPARLHASCLTKKAPSALRGTAMRPLGWRGTDAKLAGMARARQGGSDSPASSWRLQLHPGCARPLQPRARSLYGIPLPRGPARGCMAWRSRCRTNPHAGGASPYACPCQRCVSSMLPDAPCLTAHLLLLLPPYLPANSCWLLATGLQGARMPRQALAGRRPACCSPWLPWLADAMPCPCCKAGLCRSGPTGARSGSGLQKAWWELDEGGCCRAMRMRQRLWRLSIATVMRRGPSGASLSGP